MDTKDYKIHIIGAGVSGLVAAQILENYDYKPVILEATDRVGGRVKTDRIDGYQLDHGFQVLLDAYPKAREYLDYDQLDLQGLLPGAVLYNKGSKQTLGDPLRSLSLAIPTLLAEVGSIADKIRVLKLNLSLSRKSLESVFAEPEITTLEYLKRKGFSDKMIHGFFKPFFTGIFLEPDLKTSSRMFEFVYKMFGSGLATIPKDGMQAIPDQLAARLKKTDFSFNTKVKQVTSNKIILEDSTELHSDFILIATEASMLVHNLKNQQFKWKGCDTLYFEVEKRTIEKPIIGLIIAEDALVNNIFYHSSIDSKTTGDRELLSATVIKEHILSDDNLVERVSRDLNEHCGIRVGKFLKHYHILKGLPEIYELQNTISPSETQLTTGIFLAGDQLLNASLNAAMLSGERAALGIIETIENNRV